MKPTILLAAVLIVAPSAIANTATFTITDNFGPGPSITYTQIVGPTSSPDRASSTESSSPCSTLSLSGCSLGVFSAPLPLINLPPNSRIISASLDFQFIPQLSDSGLSIVSVVPIDPVQPSIAGIAGTHFEQFTFFANTALGQLEFPGVLTVGEDPSLSADYTAPTQVAVRNSMLLSPITLDFEMSFGEGNGISVDAGENAITTFGENFQMSNSSLEAAMTVNYTPVPEPAGWALALVGALCVVRKISR